MYASDFVPDVRKEAEDWRRPWMKRTGFPVGGTESLWSLWMERMKPSSVVMLYVVRERPNAVATVAREVVGGGGVL